MAACGQEAERLAALVEQLDADEFLTREKATESLVKAGTAALPALRKVLTSGSLEATSRAFYILRELGLAASFDGSDEAWALLSELAERKEVPTIARRAAATLAELTRRRSAQALAELETLGAKISRNQVLTGIALEQSITALEIGPDFRGGEHDLWRLKWLSDVPQLIFIGEKVTEGWIKHATAAPGLEELHLYQTPIGDSALAALAGHASLEQIGLYYTPVGDEGLAALAKLPALDFVKLYGTQVTARKADELKAATSLAIDFRRGAFLGVGCSTLDGTCKISTVHKDSPAQKAGLQEEDVIVRYGQTPITTFDTLTDLIRQHGAGDEVEIEVQRRTLDADGLPMSKRVVAKVTFTPWEMKPAVEQPSRR
jgi:hypothetical protein